MPLIAIINGMAVLQPLQKFKRIRPLVSGNYCHTIIHDIRYTLLSPYNFLFFILIVVSPIVVKITYLVHLPTNRKG